MPISRHDPWDVLNQFSTDLNHWFGPQRPPRRTDEQGNVVASDWVPAVDIREEPDKFVIYADVPGVDPQDIDINMEKGILSISGERSRTREEERAGYKRTERARGTFLRRFSLPDTADAEQISARCRNGELEVTIPKQESHQRRRIRVEN